MAKSKEDIGGQEHWEKEYDPTPRGNPRRGGVRNWDPMPSKDRPRTHNEINETDH